MNQPKWKCIANLGDVNPIDHGGLFVFVDETGVYPPEAEKLLPPDDDSDGTDWRIHRFVLADCFYVDGILSDNRFHKDSPAWFADDLNSVASYIGMALDELVLLFLSNDPQNRAMAWEAVGSYFGYENLDSYQLTQTRLEVRGRYEP